MVVPAEVRRKTLLLMAVVSEHWNEEIAQNIKQYLESGVYPSNLPSSEGNKRRNFRKRAANFVVKEGKLYYKNCKDGLTRLAIASEKEQQEIFQVGKIFSLL